MQEAGERVSSSKLKSVGPERGSKTKTAEDAMRDPEEGKGRNIQEIGDRSRQHPSN